MTTFIEKATDATTQTSYERFVISLEGSSLKQNLPPVRAGSSIKFWFQIIDYNPDIPGRVLRAKHVVYMTWTDDFLRCTTPDPCPEPEKDAAMGLFSSVTAAVLLIASLFSF